MCVISFLFFFSPRCKIPAQTGIDRHDLLQLGLAHHIQLCKSDGSYARCALVAVGPKRKQSKLPKVLTCIES